MRVVYVARHGGHGNCDEDAIAYVLRSMGHEVICIPQQYGTKAVSEHCDMLLYHKWFDTRTISKHNGKAVRVAWHFDLLRPPGDRRLAISVARQANVSDLVFATDGDWINSKNLKYRNKVYWLPQGADERVVGAAVAEHCTYPLMFAGSNSLGQGRRDWLAEVVSRWDGKLMHLNRFYRRDLAYKIATTKVVLAPDSPGSNYYWSNRVYLMLGFGAFLLHPYYEGLASQYVENKEIVCYRSREEMHDKIAYFIEHESERKAIAAAGLERTKREHLYRHRVTKIMQLVEERLATGL